MAKLLKMREMNINIEGYNVNGICVGCLNYNRKMFYTNEVKECFKYLANIDVPDGLTIQVCWECLAAVRATNRFQLQILTSYDILIKYSQQHTFLNSPVDLTQYAHQRLTTAAVDIDPTIEPLKREEKDLEIKDFQDLEVVIKAEDDLFNKFAGSFEVEDLELLKTETEPDQTQDSQYSDDFPSQDATSDDDVQLSKLKRKKERREKKRGRKRSGEKTKRNESKDDLPRNSRKLRNLPEGAVELYTMTEEEMWQIRTEDRESAEFANLKYSCRDCIIGFNCKRLMIDHMNGKHKPKGDDCRQCDVCKAYFITKDNLSCHRALHLAAYRCSACGARTTLKRVIVPHALRHAGARGLVYGCRQCGTEFGSKSKLSYHRNVCHQEKPQCDCCGKVFANKMTLKYHLKVVPQNKAGKSTEKVYIQCKGCPKVFYSKKSYRAHVVIHDGLSYPCPICGKLFQWKRNLARHTRNHRERDAGALHECRECGKTFSSRDCYNNHMRMSKRHVPEDAYGHVCNYCGKKFASKWCMVDHIDWDHLKRIKYQCSVCFKAFKTAKIMVAHMNNIHEGKKNKEPESEHLCEICGKSYKTVKRLKGHVWAMHTNRSTTKSFKCKLCPATFTWQTSIYKHTKMMHDADKRTKMPRLMPPVKKREPYMEADPAPVQYFQPSFVQTVVQVPPQICIVQNNV